VKAQSHGPEVCSPSCSPHIAIFFFYSLIIGRKKEMKAKKDTPTKQLALGTSGPYLNGDYSKVLKGPPPDEVYDALEAVKLETELLLKQLTRRTKPPELIQAHNTYSWQDYRISIRAGFVPSEELEQAGALKAKSGLAFRFERKVVERVSNRRVSEYGLLFAAEKPINGGREVKHPC
jgi:hypothetical protein